MTPYEITILIHCYARAGPWIDSGIDENAPIFPNTIKMLRERYELIEPASHNPCGWKATERGKAHIEQLCQLPLPQQVWVGADSKVIEL